MFDSLKHRISSFLIKFYASQMVYVTKNTNQILVKIKKKSSQLHFALPLTFIQLIFWTMEKERMWKKLSV